MTTQFKQLIFLLLVSIGLAILFVLVPNDEGVPQLIEKNMLQQAIQKNSMAIEPLPLSVTLNHQKVALGKQLFHDVRLSKDDTISCASCHGLESAGVDGLPHSFGIDGQEGSINAPTVYNSGFNFVQFWDGRAGTLEEQASGPIHNPVEMGSNWDEVIGKLSQDKRYQMLFSQLYGGGVSPEFVQDAIATFERSLVTSDSRFDRYLRGDEKALSMEEKEGYQLFRSYGCIACHQGVNIGGNMFQNFGVFGNYFKDRGHITQTDYGRFNVTGLERDRYKFKVPSLRLVAKTAPYFHDGTVKTLNEAVKIMAKYQLGREIPDTEVANIVLFLQSLEGKQESAL